MFLAEPDFGVEQVESDVMSAGVFSPDSLDKPIPQDCPAGLGLGFGVVLLASMLMLAPAVWAASAADIKNPSASPAIGTGPTLRLGYGPDVSGDNSTASFLYFVRLISPEPVSTLTSPGSTQMARVVSARRSFGRDSFAVKCDFEITGQGFQENHFDLGNIIRRHEARLKAGGVVRRQLNSITVAGAGSGRFEISGTVSNGVPVVMEVRLQFDVRGRVSPVLIELCDLRCRDGQFLHQDEVEARVSSLTFRRQSGLPKMEVGVASVSAKGAGKSLWHSLTGGVKGMVANLFIPPLLVQPIGNQAMLDFGQALVAGESSFTFPLARNLTADKSHLGISR